MTSKPRRTAIRSDDAAVGEPPTGPFDARLAGAIAALALVVRAVHLFQIKSAPFFSVLMGDSRSYDTWAQQIAAGDWIGHDVFYQAPLYPYFLGTIYTLFGHDVMAVRVVQAILGSVAAVLVAHATFRLFGRGAALCAGVMAALYPTSIFFDGLLQKTALDGFLTSVALWIISGIVVRTSRWSRWLGLGIVIGALSLTRENALLLAVLLAGWAVWPGLGKASAGSLVSGAAFVAGLALLLMPVAIRNYAVGGGFYLTTSQFGPNLYLGNNARTDGTAGALIAGRGSAEYERQDATEIAERAAGKTLTPGEVSEYWTSQATAFIVSQPGPWLRLIARKTALFWNAYEAFDTESQEWHADYSWLLRMLGHVGHFGILVPLAAAGVWITWADRRRLLVFYVVMAAYSASVIAFFIYARYRYPIVPFLLLFAAPAMVSLPSFVRARSARELAPLGALVAVLLVFTNWPVLATEDTRAVSEHNLGATYQSDGRIDEAMAAYTRALAINPTFGPAHVSLGNALMRQGRTELAITHFQQALVATPQSAEVQTNLGIALMSVGRTAEGVAALKRAVALAPSSIEPHLALGEALPEIGDADGARMALARAVGLDPTRPDTQRAFGRLLIEQHRPAEAIEHLQFAAQRAPSAEVHNELGIALATSGRVNDAIVEFRRALALDGSMAEARRNLEAATADAARTR